jgi:hypothetical protein
VRGAIHRFLDENLLTIANVTPSEVAAGQITQATKTVSSGGAAGTPGGTYTGLVELQWVVKISSVGGGTSIGQAQYQYSTDGGATFSVAATTAASVSLESGVTFAWTAAVSGPDFALHDEWRFKTLLPHGVAAMLDFQDRNLYYESVDDANEVFFTVDLGAQEVVRSWVIMDHNLTDDAVGTVKGHTTNSFGAPTHNLTPTYATPHMGTYVRGAGTGASLPTACRYWRFGFSDPTNPDGVIRIGKMYLGSYKQCLSRPSTVLPYQPEQIKNGFNIEGSRGFRRESVEAVRQRFPLLFPRISTADKDMFVEMKNNVWNATEKLHIPLIWIPDHREIHNMHMCWLDNFGPVSMTNKLPSSTDESRWNVPMTFLEVVKL